MRLRAQSAPGAALQFSYLVDVDGDGVLDEADTALMEGALFTSRGFEIDPHPGYDHRADIFGKARVDQESVDALASGMARFGSMAVPAQRPITVAWHYGWYDSRQRPLLHQTVRYLGGDYLSNDSGVETDFNRLKNEFGVTVDALSWMPHRVRASLRQNYESGYFSASNAHTRYVALLYENTLALPETLGRNDFRKQEVANLLVADFEAMARTFVEARDRHATRIFLLSGRPVVFIFGSHQWGLDEEDEVEQSRIGDVIGEARDVFKSVYGVHPYLVGEELLSLAATVQPPAGRVSRAANFDAWYSYHAGNLKTSAQPFAIDETYGGFQRRRLERVARAAQGIRNRFTGQRIMIIPNLAGGFAKHGMPTLTATRYAYADYMRELSDYYENSYLPQWPGGSVGTSLLPAPIYTVGSWNEEFEGHAIFPAEFNLAFGPAVQGGFDYVMALKQVFGWNHYSTRDILGS